MLWKAKGTSVCPSYARPREASKEQLTPGTPREWISFKGSHVLLLRYSTGASQRKAPSQNKYAAPQAH